ncbi:hypothetical protein AHMF7605_21870 [Adhaeribacter arboris]|uniref:GNAT family N-acetyltransferase n=1 Tax=Adhaeribacter arboris TaxID=2072846 RepID=A0A2T2YKC6_9BACT|nr:hypothetical protein [Adhaeribacter arboris]PSR55960.1 hypothetical protein AHMF7605_21870 [Adhaeribacter arboris]
MAGIIKNNVLNEYLLTEISPLTPAEFKEISKKNGWRFDWTVEFTHLQRQVFKVTVTKHPTIIQGIISLELKPDHVYIHLIESAPFNIGRNKLYSGVALTLVGYARQLSQKHGGGGCVQFIAEPELVNHYIKNWVAGPLGKLLMVLPAATA